MDQEMRERAERRRQTMTVKKLRMDSPNFKEENMAITDGTPQECWDAFWDFVPFATMLCGGTIDFSKPIQRNVAKKTSWAERMAEGNI
ncbi:MAG: hypothetical protein LBU70_06485 [Chitinispirillales bacterium]|jgi:hypothetical protein|nr:hypothetical protein [Chitinispirillales bacterium]